MKDTNRPLVVGNWKMNPISITDAKKLASSLKIPAKKADHAEVVIAPPFLYLSEVSKLSAKSQLAVAAQNVFYEISGAYTGEVSADMLTSVGVEYIIIGHSERRAMGETDDLIAKKLQATLKAKLQPILCVGEIKRDSHGNFFDGIAKQLRVALKDVPKSRAVHIVVAYEPIWAIGTGKTATAEDVEEMRIYIHKVLAEIFGRNAAIKVRIIYGGSVKPDNARKLYIEGGVNGFLVGGASLKTDSFTSIINSTK